MADTKTVSSIQRVAVKQAGGTLGEESYLGSTSDYIIHKRVVGDTEQYYTADKILNNYLDFIETAPFIYVNSNTEPSAPLNTDHIAIWIDRSATNQDGLDIE